ncbi:SDR family NAD(P)-dependent oxidoreductase [Sinorhizobium sp. RAC02]|uniref:SDR family NAD(P)-dependent oxidoreductase n=1 Tax=Sinorhizobium sp. RAC02 TaxID=1842534 RepID=UPI00083D9259|nr:SDR family NAD(P)-dependent oxidoreductase [Sinorhizobium sp. RAC02]AOF94453.1 short chain dehydrogenase family protein [Sinorhizobium sp. RAC02]
MTDRKVALVVGASRGLGLGLVHAFMSRGWEVIATVRNEHGRSILKPLVDEGPVSIAHMDINVPDDIRVLRKKLSERSLDVLFVNAGVAIDPTIAVESISTQDFVDVMVTNALSPLRVLGALHDLVAPDGVVAAMSSGMGSINDNAGGGWEIYRASKAALNQMMKSFAVRKADGRTYITISPGWVRTEMGGGEAPLDIETSAAGVVETLIVRSGARGVHFVDFRNQPIAW